MLPALLESVLKISTRCVLRWIGPYFHVAKSKIGNSHLKASTLASFPGLAFRRLQYDFLFVCRKSLGMRLHQHCNLRICSQNYFCFILVFFVYVDL